MFKRHNRKPQSLNQHSWRCEMFTGILRAILQLPKMRRMGKMRMMMKKRQSSLSWAKMMNLAGWWAQSPTSTAPDGELSAEADKAWRTDAMRMEGRSRLLPWQRYKVQDNWIQGSGSCDSPNRNDSSHTVTDNICRAYAGSWCCAWTIPNATSDISTGQ